MNYYYLDVITWAILMLLAARRWDHSVYSTVASVVALLCFILWMTTRIQLGASFRLKAEAHRLVTIGLYRRIKNPIYTLSFGAFLCVLAALRTWVGIAIFCAVFSLQIIRIKREEKVLEEAFGDE